MSVGADEALHPDAAVLGVLLGTWVGEGAGQYPTIQPFGYREELRFWHAGKPFVAYTQRTWALDDGRPMHTESGYWRPKPGGVIELVVAHPTGHVEIEEGTATVTGTCDAGEVLVLELVSRLVGATSTAKPVAAMGRRITVRDRVLTHALAMAAVGQPLQPHLLADLRRSDES